MVPLKDAIAEKHRQAEQMVFNQKMFAGELTSEQYATYLTQLLQIFGTLELYMLPNIHLYRTAILLDDMRELSNEKLPTLQSTQYYVNYLRPLTDAERLPHIYLHYLALLYGGQMMKDKVPGAGRLYDFKNPRECIQSIRELQDDSWADEANKGLDYFMDILDELQYIFKLTRS
jgi:heme oxygenase